MFDPIPERSRPPDGGRRRAADDDRQGGDGTEAADSPPVGARRAVRDPRRREALLGMQRTVGNAGVVRSLRESMREGGATRQGDQGAAGGANDPAALLLLRSEELFQLYLSDHPEDEVGAARYERTWLMGPAGTRAIQRAIQHHLDLKVREGRRDHLDYFLTFVDRLSGSDERRTWLRNAIGFRLRQTENAQAREAGRLAREVADVGSAAAPIVGVPAPVARAVSSRLVGFGAGVWEGMSRQITEDEVDDLAMRFLAGWAGGMILPPYFLTGVSVGIAESGWETAKAIFPLLERDGFNQMVEQVQALAGDLCGPSGPEVAYQLGVHVGRDEAAQIEDALRSNVLLLPLQLGRLTGPIIFEVVMMLVGGEGVVLSALARRLRPFLSGARLATIRTVGRSAGAAVPDAGAASILPRPREVGGVRELPAPQVVRDAAPSPTPAAAPGSAGPAAGGAAAPAPAPGAPVRAAARAVGVEELDVAQVMADARRNPRAVYVVDNIEGPGAIFDNVWRSHGGQGRVMAYRLLESGQIRVARGRFPAADQAELDLLLRVAERRAAAARAAARRELGEAATSPGAPAAPAARRELEEAATQAVAPVAPSDAGRRQLGEAATEPAPPGAQPVPAPGAPVRAAARAVRVRELSPAEVLAEARRNPGAVNVVVNLEAIFDWTWRDAGGQGQVSAYQLLDTGRIRVAQGRFPADAQAELERLIRELNRRGR